MPSTPSKRRTFSPRKDFCRLALAAALATAALPQVAAAADRFDPAAAEPGTDIPAATIKFGMRPYADNTFYIIAHEEGLVRGGRHQVRPEPYGLKVTDTNVTRCCSTGSSTSFSEYCPLMLPTYKTSEQAEMRRLHRQLPRQGDPGQSELEAEVVQGLHQGGQDLRRRDQRRARADGGQDAGRRAAAQRPAVRGRRRRSSPASNGTCSVLDDAKALVLAKAGRDQLRQPRRRADRLHADAGGLDRSHRHRRPVSSTAPAALDSPVEPLVAIVGIGANADYVNANQNTVLRFLSVVWRTIDAVKKDPSLFDLQAPYLNSVAGTSLDGKGVEATVKILHPLLALRVRQRPISTTIEQSSTTRMPGARSSRTIEEHGIIPEGAVTADDIIWGGADLAPDGRLPGQDGRLLTKLEGKTLERRQAGARGEGQSTTTTSYRLPRRLSPRLAAVELSGALPVRTQPASVSSGTDDTAVRGRQAATLGCRRSRARVRSTLCASPGLVARARRSLAASDLRPAADPPADATAVACAVCDDFFLAPAACLLRPARRPDCSSSMHLHRRATSLIAVALGSVDRHDRAASSPPASAVARAIIDPIMMTAGTVPILVMAPFFLIWFGVGRGERGLPGDDLRRGDPLCLRAARRRQSRPGLRGVRPAPSAPRRDGWSATS